MATKDIRIDLLIITTKILLLSLCSLSKGTVFANA
jgi:hypothetical protein